MFVLARSFLTAILFASASTCLQAQTSASTGCVLNKDVYTCDPHIFKKSLDSAKTVTIETRQTDHISEPQLKDLAHALGKRTKAAPADLTFVISPASSTGIYIGPAGSELATLRIYGPGSNGQHGDLLWAETLTGQPDLTWPAIVHALIQQFQAKFK
jgi:hypothetical protein